MIWGDERFRWPLESLVDQSTVVQCIYGEGPLLSRLEGCKGFLEVGLLENTAHGREQVICG